MGRKSRKKRARWASVLTLCASREVTSDVSEPESDSPEPGGSVDDEPVARGIVAEDRAIHRLWNTVKSGVKQATNTRQTARNAYDATRTATTKPLEVHPLPYEGDGVFPLCKDYEIFTVAKKPTATGRNAGAVCKKPSPIMAEPDISLYAVDSEAQDGNIKVASVNPTTSGCSIPGRSRKPNARVSRHRRSVSKMKAQAIQIAGDVLTSEPPSADVPLSDTTTGSARRRHKASIQTPPTSESGCITSESGCITSESGSITSEACTTPSSDRNKPQVMWDSNRPRRTADDFEIKPYRPRSRSDDPPSERVKFYNPQKERREKQQMLYKMNKAGLRTSTVRKRQGGQKWEVDDVQSSPSPSQAPSWSLLKLMEQRQSPATIELLQEKMMRAERRRREHMENRKAKLRASSLRRNQSIQRQPLEDEWSKEKEASQLEQVIPDAEDKVLVLASKDSELDHRQHNDSQICINGESEGSVQLEEDDTNAGIKEQKCEMKVGKVFLTELQDETTNDVEHCSPEEANKAGLSAPRVVVTSYGSHPSTPPDGKRRSSTSTSLGHLAGAEGDLCVDDLDERLVTEDDMAKREEGLPDVEGKQTSVQEKETKGNSEMTEERQEEVVKEHLQKVGTAQCLDMHPQDVQHSNSSKLPLARNTVSDSRVCHPATVSTRPVLHTQSQDAVTPQSTDPATLPNRVYAGQHTEAVGLQTTDRLPESPTTRPGNSQLPESMEGCGYVNRSHMSQSRRKTQAEQQPLFESPLWMSFTQNLLSDTLYSNHDGNTSGASVPIESNGASGITSEGSSCQLDSDSVAHTSSSASEGSSTASSTSEEDLFQELVPEPLVLEDIDENDWSLPSDQIF